MQTVEGWLDRLRKSDGAGRAEARSALVTLASGAEGKAVREFLDNARRGELLEVQWEIEEILEETTPRKAEPAPVAAAPAPAEPPPEAAEPPAEEAAPGRALSMKDLVTVYDDPRGLLLHKTKVGDRWFATQADPYSGQPQTFELRPAEVAQLKTQLARSPYWVLGSGGPAA
jgi:hypothetical protein